MSASDSRIAVFPGSFDPITLGHSDLIDRALPLFDKIIIALGENSHKTTLFTLEQRLSWIQQLYSHDPRIEVSIYKGLTVDFCKAKNARFLLRGIRNTTDFDYERSIADVNRQLYPGLETIFLACSPAYSTLASNLVRDIIKLNGPYQQFVPRTVIVNPKST